MGYWKTWRADRLTFAGALFAGASIAALISSSVIAMTSQSIATLSTIASQAMEQRALAAGYSNIEVSVRSLDNRLQLTACNTPISVLPNSSQRALGPVTVGLRCDTPERWTIHVRGNAERQLPHPPGHKSRRHHYARDVVANGTDRPRDTGLMTTDITVKKLVNIWPQDTVVRCGVTNTCRGR